jgi:hypothetical protein
MMQDNLMKKPACVQGVRPMRPTLLDVSLHAYSNYVPLCSMHNSCCINVLLVMTLATKQSLNSQAPDLLDTEAAWQTAEPAAVRGLHCCRRTARIAQRATRALVYRVKQVPIPAKALLSSARHHVYYAWNLDAERSFELLLQKHPCSKMLLAAAVLRLWLQHIVMAYACWRLT